MTSEESNRLNEEITNKSDHMREQGYEPVFLAVSNMRTSFAGYVKQYFGNWACISDVELYSIYKDYNIVIEEELVVNEIKVDESCLGSN